MGPLDWMVVRMFEFEYDGTGEKHKSVRRGEEAGEDRIVRRRSVQVQIQAQALWLSRMMGLAGADHDGGDACSCSRNDNV